MSMTGRERVRRALTRQEVDRVPWVPFVGCHAGALIGASAEDVLRSEDLLVKGVNAAIKRYRPDGIPVAFDVQVEAEALGCGLAWARENPPAVSSHPLANGTPLSTLHVPGPDAGRLGWMLRAARRLREEHPDIALYGLVTGPFTLALHLRGTDIFMDMFDAPDGVRDLMAFAAFLPLVQRQVGNADAIAINKTDTVPETEVDRLAAVLRTINPGAPLVRVSHGRTPPGFVFRLRQVERGGDLSTSPPEGIVAASFRSDSPVDRQGFEAVLHSLGDRLLR